MTPERIEAVRSDVKAAHALVARGKLPHSFLNRMRDLTRADHAALSRGAPDVTTSLRELTVAMGSMRARLRQEREMKRRP